MAENNNSTVITKNDSTSPEKEMVRRNDEEKASLNSVTVSNSTDEKKETDEGTAKTSLRHLSKRQWITLFMLTIANFCSTVAFSCIAPYYPVEGKLRGITDSQTGIVFGVFELTMFIMSPIAGIMLGKVGARKMFIMGLLITGIGAGCFGSLFLMKSTNSFFYASVSVRVLEAFGDAAFVTSSFTIATLEFPGKAIIIISIMETAAGVGFMVGPPIGGFLYEVGGFVMPMGVLCVVLLISATVAFFLIRDPEVRDDASEASADSKSGMLGLFKIPQIPIMLYAVIACSASFSYFEPMLSGHVEQFNLSPTWVGMLFLLSGGLYTITAPAYGVILDKFKCPITVLVCGTVTAFVAMLIIGPSPLLPLQKNLFLIALSQFLMGIAGGALYVPSFQNCLDAAIKHGYEDGLSTNGLVSGIFQSAWAFGGFVGPIAGGVLTDHVGFEWTTTALAFMYIILIAAVIAYVVFKKCIHRNDDKKPTENLPAICEKNAFISP